MAQFVNARHNDLIAGAPFVYTNDGLQRSNTIPPPSQPAYGIQHLSGDAPFVSFKGTPPFVPPNPRNLGYTVFAPQHDASGAPFTFVGRTPPFVAPPPRNLGYWTFPPQHDAIPHTPWSWLRSSVQQQVLVNPPRGSGVFVNIDNRGGTDSPFTFLRSTLGIATPGVTSIPAFRASFVKAGGWWDVLSEAPFFFAAGYALQPPRGPFGSVFAKIHDDGLAAYTFTLNSAAALSSVVPTPPFGGIVTTKQLDTGDAPYSFFRTLFPTANPRPPVSGVVLTRQLDPDQASFIWTYSRQVATPFPPFGGNATGPQQDATLAAYSFTRFVPPAPGQIPPFGSSVFIRQADDARAAFALAKTVYQLTQTKPLPGVFAPQHIDPRAAYVFTRDRAIIVVQAITPVATRSVFTTQLPNSSAPWVFTVDGVSPFSPFIPTGLPPVGFPIAEVQWSSDLYQPPKVFTYFNPGITQPIFQGLLVQQAIFSLVNAGLEVFITYGYSTTVPRGYVIRLDPPAGTALPPFSVVTIEASQGLPPAPGVGQTVVPDMQGMTAQDARNAIYSAGLSLGQGSWVISAQTSGTVVSQSIAALMPVPYGTIVQLTISLGPVVIIPPIVSPT